MSKADKQSNRQWFRCLGLYGYVWLWERQVLRCCPKVESDLLSLSLPNMFAPQGCHYLTDFENRCNVCVLIIVVLLLFYRRHWLPM